MKQLKTIFTLLLTSTLFWACSDDDTVNKSVWGDSYARFVRSAMTVNGTDGTAEAIVESQQSTWEITLGEGDIVSNVAPASGGNANGGQEFTKVVLTCNANPSVTETRTQVLYLTDQNGTTTELTVTQEGASGTVLAVDPSTTYQPVAGFGGMYAVSVWGTPVITADEMNKMYSPDGLGYSILRLMIYSDESRWIDDVAGAKIAQSHGAIVFACPWNIKAEWADKVDDTDHLKPECYTEYADHLIRYVEFMKENGVNIYAISVQNEPDMDFTAWTPQEVVTFLKQEGARIRETGVKLMSPEACGYQPEYTDVVLNDAEAFAQTDIVAGHLYQGFIDLSSSYVKDRHDYVCGLYPRLGGKTWWMTEHLFNDGENEEDPSLWQFWNWDYNFSHLAKEIHMCMDGYCSAYVYWYLKRFYGMIGDTDERCKEEEGEVSKNGYILAHYAQYATNTTRIAVTSGSENIDATAYINESGDEITLVLLNQSDRALTIAIPVSGISQATAVETNEEKNMEAVSVEVTGEYASLSLSGKSIVSVRLKL